MKHPGVGLFLKGNLVYTHTTTDLTKAEFDEIWHRYIKTGDSELGFTLVSSFIKYINREACSQYRCKSYDIDDLIQEGVMCVFNKLKDYRPELNTQPSTFFCIWIKQSIMRYIHNHKRTIRIPVWVYNAHKDEEILDASGGWSPLADEPDGKWYVEDEVNHTFLRQDIEKS